jgi:hypothetical protein
MEISKLNIIIMGNDTYPVKLSGTATTTLKSCLLMGINVNKTLTGTLTVNESGTAVGQFAIGTTPATYHTIPNGVRYAALTLVLSAGDDVTVFIRVQ